MTGNQLFDAPSKTGRRRSSQLAIGAAEMWVSAATLRQELLATIAERVDHRSTGITPLAANPEVLGLQ